MAIVLDGTSGITTPGITSSAAGSFTTLSATTGAAVGGATAGAGGVAFPATAVNVANANTLDDYDEATATSAACTGAITTSTGYSIIKIGKMVQITLPQVRGAGVATSVFTFGTSIPAKYRPAAESNYAIAIFDNGAISTTPGLLNITPQGAINVFRNLNASGNFTVTAQAGLVGDVVVTYAASA